jgi:hypothetical protein
VYTDKEEVCTRLAQLPCTGIHTRHRGRDTEELLIGMLASKMSCAQKTKESCERLSPKQTKGRGDGS